MFFSLYGRAVGRVTSPLCRGTLSSLACGGMSRCAMMFFVDNDRMGVMYVQIMPEKYCGICNFTLLYDS